MSNSILSYLFGEPPSPPPITLPTPFDQMGGVFLPEIRENPIACGIAWGAAGAIASHVILQVVSRTLQPKLENRDFLLSPHTIAKKTSSMVEKYIFGRLALELFFLTPLAEELLFRGKIFTYVENNFSNASTINLLVMPILFGILYLDPKQKGTNLIAFTSATTLSSLLANLREISGGLSAPISAHIAHNVFLTFMNYAAMYMGSVHLRRPEMKKD